MLTREDKANIELIKKIMTEHKTTLPFLRNQNQKRVKVETEKVNKILLNIPIGIIPKLNELIYSGMKLVCDRISNPLRNLNWNTKPRWEIRLEGEVKKLWQLEKVLRKEKHKEIC